MQLGFVSATPVVESFLPKLASGAEQFIQFSGSKLAAVFEELREAFAWHQAQCQMEMIRHDAEGKEPNAIFGAKVVPTVHQDLGRICSCQYGMTLVNGFGDAITSIIFGESSSPK
jgi:hypothetical protein